MPENTGGDVAELLELAMADPARAQVEARALLDSAPDTWWQSVARHVMGLALRESGDTSKALRELRVAVRLAERSGDEDRTADVRATLGTTLVTGGRTREGLAQLARAAAEAQEPGLRAKVSMRRGGTLTWLLGRYDEGLVDLKSALDGFLIVGDRTWEARTRNTLGILHLYLGEVGEAEQQFEAARELFTDLGNEDEAVMALHNLGQAAFTRGDLPTALSTYDLVDERETALGIDTAPLAMERTDALLGAGLADEAVEVARTEIGRGTGMPIQQAELRLKLAAALLAAGDATTAAEHARTALAAFRRTGRDWHAAHARLTILRARARAGRTDRRMVASAREVAEELTAVRSADATVAWLLAGRLATRLDPPEAPGLLLRAAADRTHPAPLVRASAWLATALERELAGDGGGVARACRRGLAELDTHRATLGSSELRALATRHGEELARLALAHAVDGPPRPLLWWGERWRATALTQPPVRPESGDEKTLAALRDTARRLAAARAEGEDATRLESERSRLEADVRRRLRHTAGTRGAAKGGLDVAALVAAVGDAAFVEFVEVGERLHAVVVRDGRVRKAALGGSAEVQRAVDFARYTLRQAARGRPATVAEAGRRLQTTLLGPAESLLRDVPAVVVSPTSRLHGTPWGLLPVLAGVPHAVVPSAALWLRARERRPASDRSVFVCGPGLTTGGAEIDVVAPRHPSATVLRDGAATVDSCLTALDGAGLAHIAAHGRFRQDSPLFSALDLDDGPLIVHDFERMDSPPHRVVLSACESGVLAPVGAGELLGLVSALLSLGTAGVAASVVVVNDDATAELMVDLHAGLERGDDLATALLRARRAAQGDPVREATAASFVALGV